MDQPLSVSHSAPDQPPAPPAKKRRLWIWAIIVMIFALLFVWVLTQHSGNKAAPGGRGGRGRGAGGTVPVTVATATQGNIGVYLDAIGTVTPMYTNTITAQVTGVITAVHYREGQTVRKGEPLIDIDCRSYEAQLNQSMGTLKRDQNLLAQGEMNLKRYQDAWAKNAIQRQTLEDQEKLILQEQGTVQNDEGSVQYYKVQTGFCHIKSPVDGRVGLRLVDPGNLVTANGSTSLVVVAKVNPITVIFTVPEDDIPQVVEQLHRSKSLTVEAYDRTKTHLLAKGKLSTVDNQIDTVTGTLKLRAEFNNSKGELFPNQFVNARLLVKTLQNQVLIPASSIQHNGSTDFVYVIANNKASMRTVKSGISDQGNTTVTGLKPGDVVANSSFEKLVDGSPISLSRISIPNTPSGAAQ
jgi:membrane fusion protein, multidrug efflux system